MKHAKRERVLTVALNKAADLLFAATEEKEGTYWRAEVHELRRIANGQETIARDERIRIIGER
ncbi:MAG TPA: hypothetical protein VIJ12_02500 [Candidatus Baltobacteraceae bacterium]